MGRLDEAVNVAEKLRVSLSVHVTTPLPECRPWRVHSRHSSHKVVLPSHCSRRPYLEQVRLTRPPACPQRACTSTTTPQPPPAPSGSKPFLRLSQTKGQCTLPRPFPGRPTTSDRALLVLGQKQLRQQVPTPRAGWKCAIRHQCRDWAIRVRRIRPTGEKGWRSIGGRPRLRLRSIR